MGYSTSTYRYCNYEEENFATSRQTSKMLVSSFENGIIQSVNLGVKRGFVFHMESPYFTLIRLYFWMIFLVYEFQEEKRRFLPRKTMSYTP